MYYDKCYIHTAASDIDYFFIVIYYNGDLDVLLYFKSKILRGYTTLRS